MASLTVADAAAAAQSLLAFRQSTAVDVDSAIELADHLETALRAIAVEDAYLGAKRDELDTHAEEAICCKCQVAGHGCTNGLCDNG